MKRRQILLITIDTLRADHLSFYGYRRLTSPAIDKIARNALVFRWAFSPISYTVPSHYSLMTGKYPSFHSVQFYNGRLPWRDSLETTLAEILLKHGFATCAFIGSSVLSLKYAPRIGKGFDRYDESMTYHESTRQSELRRRAKETNDSALEWISKHRNEDFFCWIHYMDVHGPYEVPEPHCDWFVEETRSIPSRNLKMVANGGIGGIPEYQSLDPIFEGQRLVNYQSNYHFYEARYDGGIRYVDSAIEDLVNALNTTGLYDNLLLIITSDHGEAMGENDVYFFHGMTVTMDQVHVPLIFKFPDGYMPKPRVVETQASLVDVAPTILDFLALPSPDYSQEESVLDDLCVKASGRSYGSVRRNPVLHGISLLPSIKGETVKEVLERVVFSEIETQVSSIDSQIQYLIGRSRPEQLQFAFFHPDAISTRRAFKYRVCASVSEDCLDQNLTRASLDYIRASWKARMENMRMLNSTSDRSGLEGDKEQDDSKILSHLKALGYA